MRKVFSILLLAAILVAPAWASYLTSVRTEVYNPNSTITSLGTNSAVTVIGSWSNLHPFYTKGIWVKNDAAAAGEISATVEASYDGTIWVTVDATSLSGVGTASARVAEVNNTYPYIRVKSCSIATTTVTTSEVKLNAISR